MRRFVTLVFLLLFTIPFGISVSGCSKKAAIVFCNGSSGPLVGQLKNIDLEPKTQGISLNFGEIGQSNSPTATDCQGNSVSVGKYSYGTSDMTIADIDPATGRLCAGTWNRNSGAGIPDFTNCIPTNKSGTAYITASGIGGGSNSVPVFVHAVVTSVVLGALSTDCVHDPASNCSPAAASTSTASTTQTSCTVDPTTGCCTAPIVSPAQSYTTNTCLSQGRTGQLAARAFSGTGSSQVNISCRVGHLAFTAQTPSIVSIDPDGIATAQAPGSTVINAETSIAGSSAGFFSTCPPAKIALSLPNSNSSSISVDQNNLQPITATVTDTNGVVLSQLNLQFVSTTPTTIPASASSSVTPIFPGAASITAICQPPSCNPSPLNAIGLFGNGKPVVSNPIAITTPGLSSTFLYIGSTQSRYIVPVDFTTNTLGTPVQLPFVPNSMVMSNDGSSIYLGSSTELMVFNAVNNTLSSQVTAIQGVVLAVSPDSSTVVISDPVRQVVYLYSSAGAIETQYGGVGTHAEFTPDSQTVYITAGNQLLVHSNFTGWTSITGSTVPSLITQPLDVAVTVPSAGAFFAGATTTARGNCPVTHLNTTSGQTTTTSDFYPDAGVTGPKTDRVAATNDGYHILGATVTPVPTFTDLRVNLGNQTSSGNATQGIACPDSGGLTFTSNPVLNSPIPGITATAITGVTPASDSSIAFVTYTGTGGVLPSYIPTLNSAGTLGNVKLSAGAIAPVSGVFSTDNSTFYVGTSGDDLIHLITKGANGFADTATPLAPKLPDANGNPAVPDLLVQRPRKTQ